MRPFTHSDAEGGDTRDRKLHDLKDRGFRGVYALSSGAIFTHQDTGRLLRDKIANGLQPSGPKDGVNNTPFAFSSGDNSSEFIADVPEVRINMPRPANTR